MQSGSFRLFRLFGIQVYLHFSWFIVAAWMISMMSQRYHSPVWGAYEYLALFGIVLMHEFGHALACRQTGGRAEQIVLWPLGGVAFVSPPPRPGPVLWSIVAGPLVNVALLPVLYLLGNFARQSQWMYTAPDAFTLVMGIAFINKVVLIFNLLPIYPLDGGQILRALLWFGIGRIRSLQVASVIGLAGGAALSGYAFLVMQSIWIGVLGLFVLSQALTGWQQAKALAIELEETKRIREDSPTGPVV
jgi:Zn-dependent protease